LVSKDKKPVWDVQSLFGEHKRVNKTQPTNVYQIGVQLSAFDFHHAPGNPFRELRKNSKPLYLFDREVVVYNDVKTHGPSDLKDICQRLSGLDNTEVVQILKDLISRGLVTKIGRGTHKTYQVSLFHGMPKVLVRPLED
jgi:hypothetical protein